MLKSLFFILLVCVETVALSQDPANFNLGEDELRNTNIYSILLDEETDLLYITTNDGAYVYKFGSFQKIPTTEDAVGTSFFDLKKHPKTGQIFCSNFNGQIFTVNHDSIQLYFEDKEELGRSFKFYFQEDRIITLSSFTIHLLTEDGEDTLSMSASDFESEPSEIKADFRGSNQLKNGNIVFMNSRSHIYYKIENGKISYFMNQVLSSKYDPIYIEFDEREFLIAPKELTNLLQEPVTFNFPIEMKDQIFRMDGGSVISLPANQGVRVLHLENDTITEVDRFLLKRKFSTCYVAKDGSIYLGTFGEGITIIPNYHRKRAVFDQNFQSITVSNENHAFLLTNDNELYEPHEQDLKLLDNILDVIERIHYVNGNFSNNNDIDSGLILDLLRTPIPIQDIFQIDSFSYLGVRYGTIFLHSETLSPKKDNLAFYEKDSYQSHYIISQIDRYISVAWSEKDSLIYFASNTGVYARPWSDLSQKRIKFKDKIFTSNDLEIYGDWLICGTKKHGILFYEKGELIAQVNKNHGLHSELVKKLKILDHYLIILTKSDLQILDLEKHVFVNVGPMEGFYPKEVIDFDVSEDQLWILEKHGFYNVPLERLQNQNSVSELYIESVNFNGTPREYQNNSIYSHFENNFSVEFDYRDILTRPGTEIYYKLEGFDLHWKKCRTTVNEIYYPYLPSGDFKMTLYAQYGTDRTTPFIYSFTIDSPFWTKWWFYLLVFSIVFGIGWIFYRIRLNYQTKKLRIKNELDNSKLTAIRSQMNPHFIFNALNSIQHLVIKGDTENTYTYINKFASLVRKTLDYSAIDSISLADEISLIEVYLSLEKLRFKDSFNYHIIAPIDLDTRIPAMLLQPFIENAIVHGLLHKQGQKELTITFQLDDHLLCIIEDNGVGRVRSREIKQRQTGSHKSFSMNAIKRRFEILNNYYHTDLGFEFEDLTPANELDVVTRVVIRIPINVGH